MNRRIIAWCVVLALLISYVPTNVFIGKAAADEDFSAWNQVYYEYIEKEIVQTRKNGGWFGETYELIYIDNDEIPEIWIYYEPTGQFGELISYQKGTIVRQSTGRWPITYAESNKYFYFSGGTFGTGGCWDKVYSLENGKINEVASGTYTSTTGNYDGTVVYTWNNRVVSKEEYHNGIYQYLDLEITRNTNEELNRVFDFDGILSYLSSVQDEDTESGYYVHNEWINQHISYAASELYNLDIVPGYNNRMLAVFRDALNDKNVEKYSIAKQTTKYLNLDFELSESDVYELLLADILYNRPGLQEMQNSFWQNLCDGAVNIVALGVEIAKAAKDAKEIPENVYESILEMSKILSRGDFLSSVFWETYDKFISYINSLKDLNLSRPEIKKLVKNTLQKKEAQ